MVFARFKDHFIKLFSVYSPEIFLISDVEPKTSLTMTLKPFTGRLRFWFYSDEKHMFFENAMDCSPGK